MFTCNGLLRLNHEQCSVCDSRLPEAVLFSCFTTSSGCGAEQSTALQILYRPMYLPSCTVCTSDQQTEMLLWNAVYKCVPSFYSRTRWLNFATAILQIKTRYAGTPDELVCWRPAEGWAYANITEWLKVSRFSECNWPVNRGKELHQTGNALRRL